MNPRPSADALESRREYWRGIDDVVAYERMTEQRKKYLDALDNPLLAICQGNVLELASGTGRFLLKLKTQPAITQLVGVDLAPQMLRAAHAKGLRRLLQANAEQLPLAAGSFDAVVCTFFSLRDMDRPPVYGEVARVLRPGGRFGFTLRSYYANYIETLWQQFVRRGCWPRSFRTLDGADGVEHDVKDFNAEIRALENAGLRVREIKVLQFLPFVRRFLPYRYWSGARATRFGSDIIAIAER